MTDSEPRFSVVIPTHRRRASAVRAVSALELQTLRDFEVVVVVDGPGDGSAAALLALRTSFPLRVIEQAHGGAAAARNTGAAAALGEVLLFLDDDMEADPELLAEHDCSRRAGADVVLGDLPLHPDSPRNTLSWGVGQWARERRERLSAPGAVVGLEDMLSGQLSIRREAFQALGGFDTGLTRGGLYGGEDIDLGYRIRAAGWRVVFNPAAVSYQHYEVDAADFLRRAYATGRSEAEMTAKHPGERGVIGHQHAFGSGAARLLLGPLTRAPAFAGWPLRAATVALVRSGRHSTRIHTVFRAVRVMEHLRGVHATRRKLALGRTIVLAYHAIEEGLEQDPVLSRYTVTPERFAAQLERLARRGWEFIDLERLLAGLDGRARMPPRSLLLSFDDAYVNLLERAVPVLSQRSIPAVAFAVAGRLGATNRWDRELGARQLPLLDPSGLRAAASAGVEIGSHGMSHRRMADLPAAELHDELHGSAERLEALGLPRPRALAYPYGAWRPELSVAAREAGYAVAFCVSPGAVRPGQDRYALPRVEVLAADRPFVLELSIATATWPRRARERLLRVARRPRPSPRP